MGLSKVDTATTLCASDRFLCILESWECCPQQAAPRLKRLDSAAQLLFCMHALLGIPRVSVSATFVNFLHSSAPQACVLVFETEVLLRTAGRHPVFLSARRRLRPPLRHTPVPDLAQALLDKSLF